MPNTNGFHPLELILHYSDLGAEFGAKGVLEYERMADAFWSNPKPAHIKQCKRKQGDTVRFDPITQAYGVVDGGNVIRTFFKPIPCAAVFDSVRRAAMRKAGRCHFEIDNLAYFGVTCKQW